MQTEIKNIKKLGIIAGSGTLPFSIAEHCQNIGLPFYMLLIENNTETDLYKKHKSFNLGKIGKAIDILKTEKISHLIIAGSIKKPRLLDLKPDLIGTKLLAILSKEKFLGDNNLLSTIILFIEKYGFTIIGLEDLQIPNLFAEKGIIGKIKPSKDDLLDIEAGKKACEILGIADIGQGLIIEDKVVLSVEAIEGTDALIKRTKDLKRNSKKSGVLVKSIKPNQNHKIDMPTIGEQTILNLKNAGIAGVAIQSGTTIIINKKETIDLANKHKIFIYGF